VPQLEDDKNINTTTNDCTKMLAHSWLRYHVLHKFARFPIFTLLHRRKRYAKLHL